MATKKIDNEQVELLRTLLIVQLLQSGVSQRNVREIAACDIHRVNAISQLLAKNKKETKEVENG
jgi:hypothetical protein